MKTDIPETAIHASYLPWLERVDVLIGKPARLDLARQTSFLAAWRARGGRRCQEPLECPTLATLADAVEAIGVNGCRPAWPHMPAAEIRYFENASRIRQYRS